MEEQLLSEPSDLLRSEPGVTLARSRQNSQKLSAEDPAKGERRKPVLKLNEVDYLLSLWQSDCAELKQAGVEMHVETAEIEGKTCICLTLMEVNFCPKCQTFHGTKEAHTCIR